MNNSIDVKNVTKNYPQFCLKNVNLEVPKGSIVGLVGENGAGKTTLIKIILNMVNKEQGTVLLFGKDHVSKERVAKEDIGVVMTDSFFSDYLRVKDLNAIMEKLYKNWDSSLFMEYMKRFQLPLNKMIKTFSTGMKMKLEIATALSHHPKLLILDEPTSGLDPIVRNEILDIFLDFIQDPERSILLSTHITSDLEHIADYITFINHGEIVMSKSRDEILENYGILKCSKEQLEKIDKQDIVRMRKNRYDLEILVNDRKQIKKKYPQVVVDKASIEDIMILYIKGEKA